MLRESQITKETAWLPDWVGRAISLRFAVPSLYIKRSEVTRHCLISTVLHVAPLNSMIACSDKWEEEFCLFRVLEHSFFHSNSWLRRDKNLNKGSRKCCV